jgi:CRP-like cAMP-binding protein
MEQDERQALLQLLQNSNAFGGLPSELLEQLIAAMSKKRIAAKVRLFAEGSFADRCLVLAKGTIDVKRGSTTAFTATSGIYNEMGVVFKCR